MYAVLRIHISTLTKRCHIYENIHINARKIKGTPKTNENQTTDKYVFFWIFLALIMEH